MAYAQLMKSGLVAGLLAPLALVAACGGATAVERPGSRATVAIDGASYAVSDVKFAYHPGEHGYFRIEGTTRGTPARTVCLACAAVWRCMAICPRA
jgi:hypothetical protein